MKKVIVYGTFDYFHYGHYNFLKQAKALGDYLIVGISTDDLCLKKGKKCILDENTRLSIVSNLKFVDEVIFETYFDQKISDVEKYNIDIYADGEDYKDIFPKTEAYNIIKDKCEIVFLKRTPGISTSELKDKLVQQLQLDQNTSDTLRSKTNEIRKDKF